MLYCGYTLVGTQTLKHLILIVFFLAISCGPTQNSGTGELKPFEISLTSYDYAAAYGLQYLLTDKELKIIFKSDLEGERDSTLFSTTLEPSEKLRTIGNLDLESLKDYYGNPCIDDGSQISVEIKKNSELKTVHLSNFYHQDIGIAIEIMNSLIPEDYKIWYDHERLIKWQTECENTQAEYKRSLSEPKPDNLFDQELEFRISEIQSFSDFPSSDHAADYDCSNWVLGEEELKKILKGSSIARSKAWRLLFSDYPCVYRGTLTQNDREFKFEINGAKWLSVTSDTTVFYADFGAYLSALYESIKRVNTRE